MNSFSNSHPLEGLRKRIFDTDIAPEVGASMRLFEDPAKFVKKASTIFECDYEALKPDKDHVGVHVIALGDWEHYGANRNYDTFPKKACESRHQTFVTHGNVFRGHNNNDRSLAIGHIVKSAYNASMGRIELFMHVDKDKAQDELHKLAKEGSHGFSMACKVPYDRCTKCGNLRKSAADPNQCECIRDHFGEIQSDGTVIGTHNDLPTWFDQSFVNRPADRISWNLKVAGVDQPSAIKAAEATRLWVPDELEADIPGYTHKHDYIKKLAAYEAHYVKLANSRRTTWSDNYLWELRKAAAYSLADVDVETMRKFEPDMLFTKLAQCGIILDAPTFFKYAFGSNYEGVADVVPAILNDVRSGLFTRMSKDGSYQTACRNIYFDVDADATSRYTDGQNVELNRFTLDKVASVGTFIGQAVDTRVIDTTISGGQPSLFVLTLGKNATDNGLAVSKGAELYAAYKLSALDAIATSGKQVNMDTLCALAAVQNLVR